MTHLEKLLAYCALAPKIEPHWKRQKMLEEKHPFLIGAAPLHALLFPFLIVCGGSFFGDFSSEQMWLMWLAGGVIFGAALFGWDASKRRQTRKKLGYSFGVIEGATNEKQTHAILEKLLRLPAPQTQELKSQLCSLADKNLLPECWWKDVEKEIDAWVASYEHDVLKVKLLESENLETIAVEVEPATHLAEPSHQHVVL